MFNLALLGKWIWRLGSDKGGLWKEILVSKYGSWISLREDGKSRKISLWWKDLKEVWASEGWGRNFEDRVEWKVGDGKDIYFWEDNWLGSDALKKEFPRLFSLILVKDAKVAELGSWSDGMWVWHLAWRRLLFVWEKPLVEQLRQALLLVRMVSREEDRWVWKGEGLQSFSVSSVYSLVMRDCVVDSSSQLWSCKVVPSTLFTAWRVLENKIATKANLVRCGAVVDSSLCCLCGKEENHYRHLFFECSFAWRVWCLCFKWLDVSFVYHRDPISIFVQFRMSQSSKLINDVWSSIWVGVVGEIWNHMNFIAFNRGWPTRLKCAL